MNFRPLSEYRRHGRACWRPDPVANDPLRTSGVEATSPLSGIGDAGTRQVSCDLPRRKCQFTGQLLEDFLRHDKGERADGHWRSASRQAISIGVANGLVRKQVAPAASARARTLSSGNAVMKMKGAT
jgi:hypothetical protein